MLKVCPRPLPARALLCPAHRSPYQPGAEGQGVRQRDTFCACLQHTLPYLSSCLNRGGGGGGQRQTRPHTLSQVTLNRGSLRVESKLQEGTHGCGGRAGGGGCGRGRWVLLPSNRPRNLYLPFLTSPPHHRGHCHPLMGLQITELGICWVSSPEPPPSLLGVS